MPHTKKQKALMHQFRQRVDEAHYCHSNAIVAYEACRNLIAAYHKGKSDGDSVEWSDVDFAYETACEALGISPH